MNKIVTRVDFPKYLNLTDYVVDKSPYKKSDTNKYRLYAVSYHAGSSPNSGHYTAICYNSRSNEWIRYNDAETSVVSESSIVTSDAYILFYIREDWKTKTKQTIINNNQVTNLIIIQFNLMEKKINL